MTLDEILINLKHYATQGGPYIYRGEPECYEEEPYCAKVSSRLWRKYHAAEHCDFQIIQQELLSGAKTHVVDELATKDDLEILSEIQHYGGDTNLIDFTTDYLIALFFACNGSFDKDGRVILAKSAFHRPRNPGHRILAQKSVFVQSSQGFLEPQNLSIIIIPSVRKKECLDYLSTAHGISTSSIYNDIHGYIKYQSLHGDAYTQFVSGFALGVQGDAEIARGHHDKARTYYEEALIHYERAAKLNPLMTDACLNRGVIYHNLGEYDKAVHEYVIAKMDNRNGLANNYLGETYYAQGKYDEAIDEFNEAINRNPHLIAAYFNRGLAKYKKGDTQQSLLDFRMVVELEPNHARAYIDRMPQDIAEQLRHSIPDDFLQLPLP